MMNEFEQAKRIKRRRIRVLFVVGIFAFSFIAITVQLVRYQIIDSEKYKRLARKQYEKKFTLPPVRGNIYDRNGNVLVSNTQYVSFAADPKILGDKATAVANSFSKVFQKPASYYLDLLQRDPQRHFVWLERMVDPSIARKLENEKTHGIVIMNEAKRLYYYDDIASTLLGCTNIDNCGIAGLELRYEDALKGIPGSIVMQRDGLGRVRPSIDYPRQEPINGNELLLTIDVTYQSIVDEELKRGVEEQLAEGGLAIMMNPKTGEILALSVYPNENPNNLGAIDISKFRNRVVSDLFEPGSVFKIVTAAAAYENKIVSPSDRFYAEHGTMKVINNGKLVRVITDAHPSDWLTFQEAIEMSSNIVFAKVSKLIGEDRLYRMARDFGFGMITGIDMPGEVRGILKKPSGWSPTTLQSMSYGYEVGVTPLQIACAYAAVANGGVLMKPYVVAAVRSPKGKIVSVQKPTPIRKLLSHQTVELLQSAFEGVIKNGTGQLVCMKSINIAGKTGTSRKWADGQYQENTYTASFVGYFPAEDPQIVCLVMLDNPKAKGYYGGTTSGPVFRAIAERVISTSYKFSTTLVAQTETDKQMRVVPDVRMLTAPVAKKMLASYDLLSNVYGSGSLVLRQSPEPGKRVQKGDIVTLDLENNSSFTKGTVRVPNVYGMSVRRALNRLAMDDFDVRIHGSGKVVSQVPQSGEVVALGSRVLLNCEFPCAVTAITTSAGIE